MIRNQSFEDQSIDGAQRGLRSFVRLMVVASHWIPLTFFTAVLVLRQMRLRQETTNVNAARKRLLEAAWHPLAEVPPGSSENGQNRGQKPPEFKL